MITLLDATRLIEAELEKRSVHVPGGLRVVEDQTITKRYGWIFFYDAKRYLETGELIDAIAGNGPIVVLASSGELIHLGTARRAEEEIARFEGQRGLDG